MSTVLDAADRVADPGRPVAPTGRLGRALGPAVAALAVTCVVAGLAAHLDTPAGARTTWFDTPEPVVGPALCLVGALLSRRAASRRMGWLLLGVGAAACTFAGARAVAVWSSADGEPGALGAVTAWLSAWTWVWGFLPFVLVLPLLFPDGRPPSRRWRPVVAAAVVLPAAVSVVLALHPEVDSIDGMRNPLGTTLLEPAYPVLLPLLAVAFPLLASAAVGAVVVRVRRGTPVERRQLALFGWAVLVAGLCSFFAPPAVTSVATLLVPAAVLVAVLRYRLYDVDVLVSRTVVAAGLLTGGLVLYVGVVAWVGSAVDLGGGPAAFAGAAAVAVAFHPARMRLQRAVDRLLYGERADPYRLLTGVEAAVRAARSPQDALEQVVQAVAVSLRLPGVAAEVALPDGSLARAVAGTAAPVVDVPLVWHGTPVGRLRVAPRGRADRLDRTDERLLADLAGPVAAVAAALRLTRDVEAGRERAVAAAEEERRRLRRDLHDGLGPQLAAVVMTVDTARQALGSDPSRAGAALELAVEEARRAVADVRTLVQGLRPPALDDLGLLGALCSTGPAAGGLELLVDASGDVDGLPAAVEVAAYRIASEALTNVARHAGTGRAHLQLHRTADLLTVTVSDEGCGLRRDRRPGVGLASMRERAAEVGGSVAVGAGPAGGTVVRAQLPLPVAPAQREGS
ncbi:MAG TPA: histidine kinase [Mycobacteriales bacterium]|nr:histidine kinase [Mycobacteriales bacterium]